MSPKRLALRQAPSAAKSVERDQSPRCVSRPRAALMDEHDSPQLTSVTVLWNDSDTDSLQRLGFFGQDGKEPCGKITAKFSIEHASAVDVVPPTLRISLFKPTAEGLGSCIGPSILYPARYLGPIATRTHHTEQEYTPDFVAAGLARLGVEFASEMVFRVHHPPILTFKSRPNPQFFERPEVQKHMRLMRSLSRANRVMLFFIRDIDMDIDSAVERFNAVPVMDFPARTSEASYMAEVEAKWKEYGISTKPGTTEAQTSVKDKTGLREDKKRERSTDTVEKQAETSAGRARKRVKLHSQSQSFRLTGTNESLAGAAALQTGRAIVRATENEADTTTPTMSLTEPSGTSEAAFTRITPTGNLPHRWAEWWQFTYGPLGADRTDNAQLNLAWRTMQASRDNNTADFAAGVVDSIMHSLDINKAEEGEEGS
ncbi:hypothetical protein SLS54_006840 [Diplodia seriata]